ncbi:MAG: hypothetical protein D6753_14640 [Planctomycetota bacterium]|nr:MAG: hypothetical protein D6753_14640 [Planctomycetota bacterium]
MNMLYPFRNEIDLHVEGRISAEDAARQERTAKEILQRLVDQPGVILADEVGMGKTFVALAVAVSVALNNRGRHPVVVMTPPALQEKWCADFALFCEKCLPTSLSQRIRWDVADRAVEFLRLIDDPPERRNSVIFMTHGAMSRGLNDPWVMLALIRQSLYRKRGIAGLRRALYRSLGSLLQMKWLEKRDPDIWQRLLQTGPDTWLKILEPLEVVDDDPVPEAVVKVLPNLDTQEVFQAVQQIPLRRSINYDSYVVAARHVIKEAARSLWEECLAKTRLRLPLLILDEAHHLKNADTRLASLFRSPDALADADQISRGPLAGVFERMLFLTATPFQLGHHELCSVIDRFDGIRWKCARAPGMNRQEFTLKRQQLREALDAAQEAAVTLDHAWGRLCTEDLQVDGVPFGDSHQWWRAARQGGELTPAADDVMRCYARTKERMAAAEGLLRKWVIRHLKPRSLPGDNAKVCRRQRLVGRAILEDHPGTDQRGIPVEGRALLPFLLAARATSHHPESRPVFAEGLASSFEAFLHTRATGGKDSTDEDDDAAPQLEVDDELRWYLDRLESLIPKGESGRIDHPKVAATVRRAADIWRHGEKVVVFCHYVATGRVLRQLISHAIRAEILRLGSAKLNVPEDQVAAELDAIGKRFFDQDSPLRRACDEASIGLISRFPALENRRQDLVEIIRRNVRTPSLLVRFFPLDRHKLDADAVRVALETEDLSGLTLKETLNQFLAFLVHRCGEEERNRYIDAVKRIQTGTHFGVDAAAEYADDELQNTRPDQLLPNVRLVNGATRSETRQRLMLTFNTPFYPEVLIASSVMAEGVDLHLNCRYMIHHDLCWNPSTLEQRSGRIDRIGAKAEYAGRPIQLYLPFIAETQDEKMYRVVMDRERWFNVVMGEDYKVDVRTAEKLAERIPFPAEAANELSFKLDLTQP